jgi:hypothetical protein
MIRPALVLSVLSLLTLPAFASSKALVCRGEALSTYEKLEDGIRVVQDPHTEITIALQENGDLVGSFETTRMHRSRQFKSITPLQIAPSQGPFYWPTVPASDRFVPIKAAKGQWFSARVAASESIPAEEAPLMPEEIHVQSLSSAHAGRTTSYSFATIVDARGASRMFFVLCQ